MSSSNVLRIIRAHPNGLWIREIARLARISPATVCNYIYGYIDAKGQQRRGALEKEVEVVRLGNGAVTIVRPR